MLTIKFQIEEGPDEDGKQAITVKKVFDPIQPEDCPSKAMVATATLILNAVGQALTDHADEVYPIARSEDPNVQESLYKTHLEVCAVCSEGENSMAVIAGMLFPTAEGGGQIVIH